MDEKRRNRTSDFDLERIRRDGRPGNTSFLIQKSKALRAIVPPLLDAARNESEGVASRIRQEAIEKMEEVFNLEIERLERLRELGHPVRADEIEIVRREQTELRGFLRETPLRIDSVRLILAVI